MLEEKVRNIVEFMDEALSDNILGIVYDKDKNKLIIRSSDIFEKVTEMEKKYGIKRYAIYKFIEENSRFNIFLEDEGIYTLIYLDVTNLYKKGVGENEQSYT